MLNRKCVAQNEITLYSIFVLYIVGATVTLALTSFKEVALHGSDPNWMWNSVKCLHRSQEVMFSTITKMKGEMTSSWDLSLKFSPFYQTLPRLLVVPGLFLDIYCICILFKLTSKIIYSSNLTHLKSTCLHVMSFPFSGPLTNLPVGSL